jgi:uncharacterized membrane protein YeaQ/YmgE (transglycosylase-associated protein family)
MACLALFRKLMGGRFILETVVFARNRGEVQRRPAGVPATKEGQSMFAQHTILGWIAIGLVAGVLGKIVMPGRDPGGIIVTILIGIAGALLAGFIAQSMGWVIVGGWQNYAAATGGAVILLALYRLVMARRVR